MTQYNKNRYSYATGTKKGPRKETTEMSEIRSTFDTTILEFNGKYSGFVTAKKEEKQA